MKSILDPSFRYTPATSTDLRKTFARIRRELAAAKAARPVAAVVDLKERKRASPTKD